MKRALTLLLPSALAHGELPDAPHYRIFDREFIAVHPAHAAALSFDLSLASKGVSHGCEEAISNPGPYPSTGRTIGV